MERGQCNLSLGGKEMGLAQQRPQNLLLLPQKLRREGEKEAWGSVSEPQEYRAGWPRLPQKLQGIKRVLRHPGDKSAPQSPSSTETAPPSRNYSHGVGEPQQPPRTIS